MPETIQQCTQCHAQVALTPTPANCPACGGSLISAQAPSTNPASSQTDHRGIVLPPRHAVGGVITPR